MDRGPAADQFVLSCIRQRAMAPGVLERVEARLWQSVEAEFGLEQREAEWAAAEELGKVQHQLARAARDFALASPTRVTGPSARVQRVAGVERRGRARA